MGLEIVRSIPERQWRVFVEDHPAGGIFHTPEMFQVFERTKGYQPGFWAARNSGGRLLALLIPVQITILNGLLRRLTTRAVVNGGVLCTEDTEGQRALSHLLAVYNREMKAKVLFTELRNLTNPEGFQKVFGDHGFTYEDHLNYLVSLRDSPDSVFARLGRRTRKNIRRGLRKGKVSVDTISQRTEIAEFYRLMSEVYRTARVPLSDLSLFEAAFDVLHPKGMVRFTIARVDQVIAAVSMDLLYKGIIYGWYGGSDRRYTSYVPGELLMWHIFRWGAENRYELYDFGGAGRPDEEYGVRNFKAKFGGELVCYGRNTRVHSPVLLRVSELGYQAYRCLLGR